MHLIPILMQLSNSTRVASPSQLPLNEIKLPPGFSIALYSDGPVPSARSMAVSGGSNNATSGRDAATQAPVVVYVASQATGSVIALVDRGDGKAEESCLLLQGLNAPEGLVWHNGSLFVFEATQLRRFDGVDAAVLNGCKARRTLHAEFR